MNDNSNFPLYVQIKQDIQRKIFNGTFGKGEKLPSESQMEKYYNVSKITIRNALASLETENLVFKQQGKGTFVNFEPYKTRKGNMYTFSRDLEERGFVVTTKILDWDIVVPSDKIATAMGLPVGKCDVLAIKRLRSYQDSPFALEYSYLPAKKVADLCKSDVENNGLYKSLREVCNIKMSRSTEIFTATNLTVEESNFLQAPENQAAFHLVRIAYQDEIAMEYNKTILRGDKFKLKFELD